MDKPDNEISTFLHCRECVDERPESMSPREYTNLECGLTETGFAIQCIRHKHTVMSFTPTSLASLLHAQSANGLEVNDHLGLRDDWGFEQ